MDKRFTQLHASVLEVTKAKGMNGTTVSEVQVKIDQRYRSKNLPPDAFCTIPIGQVLHELTIENSYLEPFNRMTQARDMLSGCFRITAIGAQALEAWNAKTAAERLSDSTPRGVQGEEMGDPLVEPGSELAQVSVSDIAGMARKKNKGGRPPKTPKVETGEPVAAGNQAPPGAAPRRV